MITTVAFDLDDTLYDEVEYCRSGLRAVSEFVASSHTGLSSAEEIFQVFWRHFSQGNRTQVFNAAFTDLGIPFDDHLIRNLVRIYRNHPPRLQVPTQTRRVLEDLRATYTLALLTDGYLPAQRLKVHALRIERYFAAIIYTEHIGREHWKPSPAGFLDMLKTMGRPAQEAVYVADNPAKDFLAPNQLGMATIQVLRPSRIHMEPAPSAQHAAQHTVSDLGQLPRLLAEIARVHAT